MKILRFRNAFSSISLMLVITVSSFSTLGSIHSRIQDPIAYIDLVRQMKPVDIQISQPSGLAYSSRLNAFYVVDGLQRGNSGSTTDLIKLTTTENRRGAERIAATIEDPINMAFDEAANRLLILQAKTGRLIELPADRSGSIDPQAMIVHDITRLGLQAPQGMAVDPVSGHIFVLDASQSRLLHLVPGTGSGLEDAPVSVLDLRAAGSADLRGIAIDPATSHIHVLSPSAKKLFEFTQSGQLVDYRDLADFSLTDPQAMAFAPSSDQTDDPSQMSLYLADSGGGVMGGMQADGQIVEFSFVESATLPAGITLLPTKLVHIIDTSKAAWNPSAPDPAGLDYWPKLGRFVISDSEVDEMSIFKGKNVFLSTRAGKLTKTCSTMSFSNEPTGVAINPKNNHIFFSDDSPNDKIFELSRGPDAIYCTSDDVVKAFNVNSLYGITDAEDVAYGNNALFVAGGASAEVYRIPLGANGVLGGGDDGPMTHFDTAAWGFSDLEGIGFNRLKGTLFIVSTKKTDKYLGEVSQSGTLLRVYDLSLMGSAYNIRSDVAYAPSSVDSSKYDIYICSRGVDNDIDPNENDGRIWEIDIAP